MAKRPATAKKGNKKSPYLTKRILVTAAKSGVRRAAKETMEIMGYNIIAQDGWIVKKHANGVIERVSPLEPDNNNDIKFD
jgi:hypothetical protein